MNGQLELKLNGRKVTVMGGPYRDKPSNVKGVKLAQEINIRADVTLDVPDFGVPALKALNNPIYNALTILESEGAIYVGCMGGIGRTGMFMAVLVKTIGFINYRADRESLWGRIKLYFGMFSSNLETAKMISDPVEYVRANYLFHAVETPEQEQLVAAYDPKPVLAARKCVADGKV
jgi:hypothetical protein